MDTIASHRPQRSAAAKNGPPPVETRGTRNQTGSRRSERSHGPSGLIDASDAPIRAHHAATHSKHTHTSKLQASHDAQQQFSDDLLRSLQQMWEVPYLCHMLHRYHEVLNLPTYPLNEFERKFISGEENLVTVCLRRIVELYAASDLASLEVTSKNWYRLLVKITKESCYLLYWPSSPIEDGSLKGLPVTQQVLLFRVVLDLWLRRAAEPGSESIPSSSSDANSFHWLGTDDKGDVYWQFSDRLYREELEASDAPFPPSSGTDFPPDARQESSEDNDTPRSAKLKHKRERKAVLNDDSISFLKRSGGSDTTTRSTRNSQYRTLPNDYANNSLTHPDSDSAEALSSHHTPSRASLSSSRSHGTQSPNSAPSTPFSSITTRSKSPRMPTNNTSSDFASSAYPSQLNGASASEERKLLTVSNFEMHTGVPHRWLTHIPRITTVALDLASAEALVFILSAGKSQPMQDLVLAIQERLLGLKTESSPVRGTEALQLALSSPLPQIKKDFSEEEVSLPLKSSSEEVDEEVSKLASLSKDHRDEALKTEKEDDSMDVDRLEDAMSDSAEDSAITALMGAVERSSADSGSAAVDLASSVLKEESESVRSATKMEVSTEPAIEAPRQKRQAAVKSRNFLINGLDPLSEYEASGAMYSTGNRASASSSANGGISERKRSRGAISPPPSGDELTIRIRLTSQVKKWFKLYQETEGDDEYREEPVRKKLYRPPVSVSAHVPSSMTVTALGLGAHYHTPSSAAHHTTHHGLHTSERLLGALAAPASAPSPSASASHALVTHAPSGRVTRASAAESHLANLEEEALSVLTPSLGLTSQSPHLHGSLGSSNNAQQPSNAPVAPSLSNLNLSSPFANFGAAAGNAGNPLAALNPLASLYGNPYLGLNTAAAFNPVTGTFSAIDPVALLQYNQLLAAQAAAAAQVSPQEYLMQQRQQLYQQQLLEAHFIQQQQVLLQQRFLQQQQQVAQQLAQQQHQQQQQQQQSLQIANLGENTVNATGSTDPASSHSEPAPAAASNASNEAEPHTTAMESNTASVEEPSQISPPTASTAAEEDPQVAHATAEAPSEEAQGTAATAALNFSGLANLASIMGESENAIISSLSSASAAPSALVNDRTAPELPEESQNMAIDLPQQQSTNFQSDSHSSGVGLPEQVQQPQYVSRVEEDTGPNTPDDSNTAMMAALLASSLMDVDDAPTATSNSIETHHVPIQGHQATMLSTNVLSNRPNVFLPTDPIPATAPATSSHIGALSSLSGNTIVSPAPTALQSPFDVAISH